MSSIASRVDKATSELLMAPDWTMNLEICDAINSDLLLAKDVTKAVKKRLQHKNPAVQLLALTLLETLIKNCGEYLHLQVVERNILQEMIKIVKKKSDMQVRDKILVLLGSWQAAFGGPQSKYPQYFWAYDELRQSGVEFPQILKDEVPIFTPPVTHPTVRRPEVSFGMPPHSSTRLDEAMASERDLLSLSDFDAIQNVVDLLKDMLDAVNLKDPEAIKNEIIVDLVNQCKSHQKKLEQLVNSTADEELLAKALALNDNVQSLLDKRDAIARALPVHSSSPVLENGPTPSAQRPLPPRQAVSDEEEEDDDFAQLARRRSKGRPVDSMNTSTETAESIGSTTLQHATATDTASSSIFTGPLALPAPPQPVRTAVSKEQDMIDLLSSNLSTAHLSPHTPQTPFTPPSIASTSHPNASCTTAAPSQISPDGHGYPVPSPPAMGQSQFSPNRYGYHTSSPTSSQTRFPGDQHSYPVSSSQIYPAQQLQVPFNNYVTPWTHTSSSYPPPPWSAPVPDPSSLASSPYSIPQPYSAPSFRPVPTSSAPRMQHHASFSPRVPANSFNSRNAALLPRQTQINDEVNHSLPPSSQKAYVPSYRLFEDLVSLRTDSGSVTSGAALVLSKPGVSGQSTSGGDK